MQNGNLHTLLALFELVAVAVGAKSGLIIVFWRFRWSPSQAPATVELGMTIAPRFLGSIFWMVSRSPNVFLASEPVAVVDCD